MAGGGKAGHKLDEIKQLFAEYNVDTELVVTKHKGHAIEIVANTQLSAFDGIVAAGGDGTFFTSLWSQSYPEPVDQGGGAKDGGWNHWGRWMVRKIDPDSF